MRKILRSYLFWTYPRGSFHYDVMVTLILLFIFGSPFVINYRERPQATLTSSRGVLVKTAGVNELTYQIGADQLPGVVDDATLRDALQKRIQAISGSMTIERYLALKDADGRVTEYKVWAHR